MVMTAGRCTYLCMHGVNVCMLDSHDINIEIFIDGISNP